MIVKCAQHGHSFADSVHAAIKKFLSVLMAHNSDVLFSPEQEEWIKELMNSL